MGSTNFFWKASLAYGWILSSQVFEVILPLGPAMEPEGFLCGWNNPSSSSGVQENTLCGVWTFCFLIFNYDDLLGGFSFWIFKWKGYHRPSFSLYNPNLQPKTPKGCIETRGIYLAFWANSLAWVNILSPKLQKAILPRVYIYGREDGDEHWHK